MECTIKFIKAREIDRDRDDETLLPSSVNHVPYSFFRQFLRINLNYLPTELIDDNDGDDDDDLLILSIYNNNDVCVCKSQLMIISMMIKTSRTDKAPVFIRRIELMNGGGRCFRFWLWAYHKYNYHRANDRCHCIDNKMPRCVRVGVWVREYICVCMCFYVSIASELRAIYRTQ